MASSKYPENTPAYIDTMKDNVVRAAQVCKAAYIAWDDYEGHSSDPSADQKALLAHETALLTAADDARDSLFDALAELEKAEGR
jgi:hypothetical protein